MATTVSEMPIVEGLAHEDVDVGPCLILSRPDTFVEDEHYLYLDNESVGDRAVLRDVRVVAYTSCPAIVVILDSSGQNVRVLRDSLYTCLTGNNA